MTSVIFLKDRSEGTIKKRTWGLVSGGTEVPDLLLPLSSFPCTAHLSFSSVQSLSHVRLFATPWIAACLASLSITNSRSLPKLVYIELVMPSNHLIFCRPLLLLPSIFPSIRVFSNESVLRIRWPKYRSFISHCLGVIFPRFYEDLQDLLELTP